MPHANEQADFKAVRSGLGQPRSSVDRA